MIRDAAVRLAKRLPGLNRLVRERDQARAELAAFKVTSFVPPGHFYSPLPSVSEVRQQEALIFSDPPRELPGIGLHETEQISLVDGFRRYYRELPFGPKKTEGMRYSFDNLGYSYSDAIFLYCMLRHLRHRRVVEIGSGHSSCVTLDTNERFFGGSISTTFIDPHPALLLSLLKEGDRSAVRILPKRLQDVDLEVFTALEANDVLFVDSTHVAKIGSDVNRVFFEILPRLAAGVHVHFHDVFYPFEYPKAWIYEGRAWNEAYLLRAFLQFNDSFRIVVMNTFLEHFHERWFRDEMPLCLQNPGGSIWIRKER